MENNNIDGLIQDEIPVDDSLRMYLSEIKKYPLLSDEEVKKYATMKGDPGKIKLLKLYRTDNYKAYKLDISLLFRSLSINESYMEIIDNILSTYSKLYNNSSDSEILFKYKKKCIELNRSLNKDELKKYFNIDDGEVISNEELLEDVKKYNNYRLGFDRLFTSNLLLVIPLAVEYSRVSGLDINSLINEGNLGLIRAVDKYDPAVGTKFSTYAYYWIRQSIRRSCVSNANIRLPEFLLKKVMDFKKNVQKLEQKSEKKLTPIEISNELDMPINLVNEYLIYLQAPLQLDRSITVKESSDDIILGDVLFSDVDVEDVVLKDSLKDEILELLDILTPKEKQVVKMRYGLGEYGGISRSKSEVARELHVTCECIRQLEVKALFKLKRQVSSNEKSKSLKIYYE